MSNIHRVIVSLLSLGWAQTVLVDGTGNGSFEGGTDCSGSSYTIDGWTIVNGSQTNRWAVNSGAGASHGSQAIYITNNCGTTPPPHNYNISTTSVVHFYRDITLPPGESYLTITAYIKVQGEGAIYDFLDIFIAPTSVNPTAGSQVSSTHRIARFVNFSSSWTQINSLFCGNPGQAYRIIFSWVNDNSLGTQPPAAIDQVHITASAPSACPSLGTGVVNVPSLPYNSGAGTTCGAVNDITSANAWSCGSSAYFHGADRVWVFTPTTSGPVNITLSHNNPTSPFFGLKVYEQCPFNVGCGFCRAFCESQLGPHNLILNVTAGRTYYVVLDHSSPVNCSNYDNLFISAPAPSGNACGAPLFTSFPTVTTGTTMGAPSLGATPTCLSGSNCPGGRIGRWYQFIPTSPNMTIHVSPGTMVNPAIAVFTAASCSGPFTQVACNDDNNSCESVGLQARLQLTGLNVGQVYYLAVFPGIAGGLGDYTLGIWETASSPPSQYGQDCNQIPGDPATGPIKVCSNNFSIGAPGFLGAGFSCDLPFPVSGSGCPVSCLLAGERNIAWFLLPIQSNGHLSFNITPNVNVDYDWTLYRIDNLSNPCQAIRNGSVNPSRCSYAVPASCDGTFSTGVASCSPTPTPGCASGTCEGVSGIGWLTCVPVSAGEVYLLGISNFSTVFTGFTLNFGTSPIDYSQGQNPSIWTGGAGTQDWNQTNNWGGCPPPNSCTQDAVIYGGPANQPVVAAAETWTVRNITIPAGAKLTVNGTLRVCGHLTCNGELEGTGWIEFIGDASYPVQEIRGVLTGATQYIPNLRITRTAAGT
ncbi:MAG: hypothetical protein RML92_09140, partial [Bacteroidia bacterium]|nr:hypothetical protein [Bacteroidia bacterium]